MPDFYISPKDIVVDFLRVQLTDPRKRAETLKTENFTAFAGDKEFELTPTTGNSVSTVTILKVDSVVQVKWRDFYIDSKDDYKVVFFTALSGGEDVEVTYKFGTTNWIYPDKAREDLGDDSFPRINVLVVTSPAVRLGNFQAPVEATIHFQVDIWVKEASNSQKFTIEGREYSGIDLLEFIGYQISKAFEENESDFFPAMYHYNPLNMPRDLPFNIEYQAHHGVVEFNLKMLDVGRVTI